MRLWSLQPREVAERLLAGERFVCDPVLAECYNLDDNFRQAYGWLIGEMEQTIPRPDSVELPVWAWYRNYGEQRKPDRRRMLYNRYPREDAILELEVPDGLVLLSDFDSWHAVLNRFPILTEEEWEADPDREFSPEELAVNWRRVFDCGSKSFVQACLWTIEPEQLLKVHWGSSKR